MSNRTYLLNLQSNLLVVLLAVISTLATILLKNISQHLFPLIVEKVLPSLSKGELWKMLSSSILLNLFLIFACCVLIVLVFKPKKYTARAIQR